MIKVFTWHFVLSTWDLYNSFCQERGNGRYSWRVYSLSWRYTLLKGLTEVIYTYRSEFLSCSFN